ncbi:nucleotidyl transferase AbiEii/AbiGii toxin family protein [Dyadobacter aurulentus]|uniref:nucleotidyl transferase AbiEii/AbiGii toxin family protein n=1 Tax=Dyadobacter sp. UC 10 TaxID=2605428 RepID=UPI0011F32CF0|nr:nucleotidyl transferase AbiEii/AbiGii toxin family protein [Dyadobacter sp. UC 10]KAA0990041.1 nucleotidyl transferase AbiEii/AbiGii toxin family protein [Dyadobacter sp. UC 10]
MSQRENILRIKAVYDALEELQDSAIFIGGATVALYVQRVAEEVRPTDDVDVLIEVTGYKAYADLEEKLRSKGFTNDMESGVICRYKVQGIIVDVMPTDKQVLGFSNIWYPEGFKTAVKYDLGEGYKINIFRPEYLVASKLEAFKNRGGNDGRTSTDFEDLVYILNHRTSLWEEMRLAKEDVKLYLQQEFQKILENDHSEEWISAHLEYAEQRRVNYILGNLTEFCFGASSSEAE